MGHLAGCPGHARYIGYRAVLPQALYRALPQPRVQAR